MLETWHVRPAAQVGQSRGFSQNPDAQRPPTWTPATGVTPNPGSTAIGGEGGAAVPQSLIDNPFAASMYDRMQPSDCVATAGQ